MKKETQNSIKISGDNLDNRSPIITFAQFDMTRIRSNSHNEQSNDNIQSSPRDRDQSPIVIINSYNKKQPERTPVNFVPVSRYSKPQTTSVPDVLYDILLIKNR